MTRVDRDRELSAVQGSFSTESAATVGAVEWRRIGVEEPLGADLGWGALEDEELRRLAQLALEGNWSLKAAAARVTQARGVLSETRSERLPKGGLTPGYQRQRTSANLFDQGQAAGVSHTYGTVALPFDLAWEADLWGRVSGQVRAAHARFENARVDEAAVRLALRAEVAAVYWNWSATVVERGIVTRTLEAYRRMLELTENRRKGGVVGDLDVARARAQVRGVETELPTLDWRIEKQRHALAVLCGKNPAGFEVRLPETLRDAPLWAPEGVASQWLERRPDVAGLAWKMAAANADAGVARAAFFPRVMLRGVAGFSSIDAGAVFDWPSRFWAVGPTLELPVFDLKRRRARYGISRATYEETVAQYKQGVLVAFQEVEDLLAGERLLRARAEAEMEALTASRRVLELATNRYTAGLVSYLEVAIAQGEALARERALLRTNAERLSVGIGLIKALGGPVAQEP